MISKPMVRLVQTVHLYCTDTNFVSKWTKMKFHTTHSPRSSTRCIQDNFVAYGTFDTNHAPILRQDLYYLQTESNKLPIEPRHLGILSGSSKTIFEPIVRLAQIVHLYCTYTNTVSKQTKMRFHMTHSPKSSIGCARDDFRADGTFDTNTISKRTQTSFHLSLVTKEYRRVRPE
jgi:hypothetical protein